MPTSMSSAAAPASLSSSFLNPSSGKVPGIPAILVHFPPRLAGEPAPQASLAALAISALGESAGFFRENGSLSPAARRGTGSTGPSCCTCHFHPRGKCRVFLRKWFTFPRGRPGHRLHRHLWRHLAFPLLGKCRVFPRKRCTFPRVSVVKIRQREKTSRPRL